MAEKLLDLKLSYGAEMALLSLREIDRTRISAWYDHLRNWLNDEGVRSRSRRVPTLADTYVLQVYPDLYIAFEVGATEVTLTSIFREDSLRLAATAEPALQ